MLSVAAKLLLRHSERTAITILMLVPVVALLVSSSMVTSGYLQQATAAVELVQPSNAYIAYQAGSASPSSSTLAYDSFVNIEASGAPFAMPLLSFPSVVSDGPLRANSSILATNMTEFLATRNSTIYGELAVGENQVDAGAIIAKDLDIRVGDVLTIEAFSQARTLAVVGILNSTDQSDTGLIIPLSSSWALWPQTANRISYIEFDSINGSVVSKLSSNMTVVREEGIDQIARSFDSQTASLLTNWTYVLFALSAAASIAAASRVVTEVSQEYDTVRALGARLSAARALVFYELLIVSTVAVVLGVAAGIVSTSILGTLFKAIDGLPLAPSVNPAQLVTVGSAAFILILGAGSLSLAGLPRRIRQAGESP